MNFILIEVIDKNESKLKKILNKIFELIDKIEIQVYEKVVIRVKKIVEIEMLATILIYSL